MEQLVHELFTADVRAFVRNERIEACKTFEVKQTLVDECISELNGYEENMNLRECS